MSASPQVGAAPPYFDVLFSLLSHRDAETEAAFGRHVHWGYWEDPKSADGTAVDFGRAAENLCAQLFAHAQLSAGDQVLDVGCGFGGTLDSLALKIPGLHRIGVNIDRRQLLRGKSCFSPAGMPGSLELVQGDACHLPLAAGSCDGAFAVECLFHIDREKCLKEIGRVLKPGARLVLSDFLPPMERLHLLEHFNPADDEATVVTYGRINVLAPLEQYDKWATAAGFRRVAERDITPHTLPTYPYLRRHMQAWQDPEQGRQFDAATSALEFASRSGLLKYTVLAYEKLAD